MKRLRELEEIRHMLNVIAGRKLPKRKPL
jgi:hypothetical protein